MDPVAHTLFGAGLAEMGLKRLTRYATGTLVIGANLPDVDAIANFWGADAALYIRRGWTHGILALIVLPLLLAATVWLWHRWRGPPKYGTSPCRMGILVVLSFVAVWSHALLDWLNTYGVRLLMPFDDRWFYGDTLFIVDPWIWLLAAAGVVLARSATYPAIAGWLLLAGLTTAAIVSTDLAPLPVKLTWLVGLGALVVVRWRRPSPALQLWAARAGFGTLIVYVCASFGMARVAESVAAARFAAPQESQANPAPGVPFSHRVILVYDTAYRVVAANGDVYEVPRKEPDEIVRRALQTESIRGFANWARFPYWQVEETQGGWIVSFRDLRYQGPGAKPAGVGFAQVEVPREGNSR